MVDCPVGVEGVVLGNVVAGLWDNAVRSTLDIATTTVTIATNILALTTKTSLAVTSFSHFQALHGINHLNALFVFLAMVVWV